MIGLTVLEIEGVGFVEKGRQIMEPVIMVAVATVLVTAICTDLRSSRIPNWLTFSAMSFGVLAHGYMSGFAGGLFSFCGVGVGLGLFLLIYMSGNMGAGDVKLMAAVGAMVGPYGALLSGFLSIMVGGAYAFGAMVYEWGLVTTARKLAFAMHMTLLTGGMAWGENLQLSFRLRYGLAIAAGTLLFIFGVHPFRG
jgi:prepilin peptidase CpaA